MYAFLKIKQSFVKQQISQILTFRNKGMLKTLKHLVSSVMFPKKLFSE